MRLMERSGVASTGGESHLSEWENFSSFNETIQPAYPGRKVQSVK